MITIPKITGTAPVPPAAGGGGVPGGRGIGIGVELAGGVRPPVRLGLGGGIVGAGNPGGYVGGG